MTTKSLFSMYIGEVLSPTEFCSNFGFDDGMWNEKKITNLILNQSMII